ncbi:MAG TPA: hypothetical protein HPP83_00720 [Candidatus Hydrogenedentes bacterium]|nr:hypothetical protein [Candidatus Hydrogenedentota bacterium]
MVKGLIASFRWVLLVAAMVAATGFVLLYHDHQSVVASHREIMLARGQTVLDSLTAGIRAQGRMGRYRPDRLSAIFAELADTPDIIGLELRTQKGAVISSGGETPGFREASPRGPLWQKDRLIMVCEPLLLGHGPGGGFGFGAAQGGGQGWRRSRGEPPGMEGWEPFPTGPYLLTATLDTSAMKDKIRGEQIRFIVSTCVALLAVLLGASFLLAWVRQRDLRTALLVARERTAQQEHLTRLGAGLAHETKNPLGIVRGQAQLIADSSDSEENRARAATIVDETDRSVRQISSFLCLARPQEATVAAIDLDEFMKGFLHLIEEEAREKNIRLNSIRSGLRIWGDKELLRRAMLNLIINAFRACKSGDEIKVTAERNAGSVSLSVTDSGCGISQEDLAHVTEPYFSRFEGGSGLGLSLVKQIAMAHDWELDITSCPGQGTRVSLDGIDEVKPSHA